MLTVFIAAFIIMLVSLAGVFSVWRKAGLLIEKNLSLLVSFSAGVFLVIASHLGLEVIEQSSSFISGLAWILLGIAIIVLIFKILPSFHHHHDEDEEGSGRHSDIDAKSILFSDGIHNIGDGILLATSFGLSLSLGIITTLGIFIHELVQEVSEFFVLRQIGYSTKKILWLNFMVSGTILLGAIGGTFLLEEFELLETPLLGIAAGSFLIVVIYDLIPHSVRTSHKQTRYFSHAIWFLIGVALMLGVQSLSSFAGSHV